MSGFRSHTVGAGGKYLEARISPVKVIVRVRPLLFKETDPFRPAKLAADTFGNTVTIRSSSTGKNFRCDFHSVLAPESTQLETYLHVVDCVPLALSGENCCIFAYGQTGSGKTHTMYGPPNVSLNDEKMNYPKIEHETGIVTRIIVDLFKAINKKKDKHYDITDASENPSDATDRKITITVWCSFVQIYNEQAYDALKDEKMRYPLSIHEESENGGTYCKGLLEYVVNTPSECLELVKRGRMNRIVRETQMNLTSSRSHSVLQLTVKQRFANKKTGEVSLVQSKLNLVDLAGSEKWDITSDMSTEHISEATNINNSLHTLGRVINLLGKHGTSCDPRKNSHHIPFRDSKLTRILQESLSGNSHIFLIATLSPSEACADESISTLRFADRAKKLQTMVQINARKVAVAQGSSQELKNEIERLTSIISRFQDKRPEHAERIRSMIERENQLELELKEAKSEIERLRGRVEKNGIIEKYLANSPSLAIRGTTFSVPIEEDLKSNGDLAAYSEEDPNYLCKLLFTAYKDLNGRLKKFFRYEIEEEQLRSDVRAICDRFEGATRPWLPYMGNADSCLIADGSGFNSSSSVSSVPSAFGGDGAPVEKPTYYRIRGEAPQSTCYTEESCDAKREEHLRNELRKAKEQMKRNVDLKNWLEQKQQRRVEERQREEQRRAAEEEAKKLRDIKFRMRAERQKKKLREYYEKFQNEAMDSTSSVTGGSSSKSFT